VAASTARVRAPAPQPAKRTARAQPSPAAPERTARARPAPPAAGRTAAAAPGRRVAPQAAERGATRSRSVALTPSTVTSAPPVEGASAAANQAVDRNVTEVHLPVVGRIGLPPTDHLAWYGGVAILTALELLEWPVALTLTIGKVLSDNRTHRTVRALGNALEELG
jgi:hypothetical protein